MQSTLFSARPSHVQKVLHLLPGYKHSVLLTLCCAESIPSSWVRATSISFELEK